MGQKILVVDDEASDRKKMVAALEKEGYSVTEASGAMDALNKVQEILPDLVITDVLMPETTGFDLCRHIKALLQPNPPLVLLVTGKAQGVNVSLAHHMGADNFEAKTNDMSLVIKATRGLLLHR